VTDEGMEFGEVCAGFAGEGLLVVVVLELELELLGSTARVTFWGSRLESVHPGFLRQRFPD